MAWPLPRPTRARARTTARTALTATLVTSALAAAACGTGSAASSEHATTPDSPTVLAASGRSRCAAPHRLVLAEPAGSARRYLGAFPFFGNEEDRVSARAIRSFERAAGRRLAWAYASDNWFGGIRFPTRAVRTIRAHGAVPFLRLMPRSNWREGVRDPRYSMASIIAGRHDRALRAWARAARRSGGPLILEFATEANGDWFPWSGAFNGGAATSGYGDPAWPDGPERVRDAYRHVVQVFRRAGARNVTWVFHLDAAASPDADWNAARWYWPGDAWVDWIGLSAYGPQRPDEPFTSFDEAFAPGYAEAAALSSTRPIALVEFAIAAGQRWDEAAWTRDAFAAIDSGRYPRLRAVAWWHERWRDDDGVVSDLRITSSPALQRSFRRAVRTPRYVSRARFRCR